MKLSRTPAVEDDRERSLLPRLRRVDGRDDPCMLHPRDSSCVRKFGCCFFRGFIGCGASQTAGEGSDGGTRKVEECITLPGWVATRTFSVSLALSHSLSPSLRSHIFGKSKKRRKNPSGKLCSAVRERRFGKEWMDGMGDGDGERDENLGGKKKKKPKDMSFTFRL